MIMNIYDYHINEVFDYANAVYRHSLYVGFVHGRPVLATIYADKNAVFFEFVGGWASDEARSVLVERIHGCMPNMAINEYVHFVTVEPKQKLKK